MASASSQGAALSGEDLLRKVAAQIAKYQTQLMADEQPPSVLNKVSNYVVAREQTASSTKRNVASSVAQSSPDSLSQSSLVITDVMIKSKRFDDSIPQYSCSTQSAEIRVKLEPVDDHAQVQPSASESAEIAVKPADAASARGSAVSTTKTELESGEGSGTFNVPWIIVRVIETPAKIENPVPLAAAQSTSQSRNPVDVKVEIKLEQLDDSATSMFDLDQDSEDAHTYVVAPCEDIDFDLDCYKILGVAFQSKKITIECSFKARMAPYKSNQDFSAKQSRNVIVSSKLIASLPRQS